MGGLVWLAIVIWICLRVYKQSNANKAKTGKQSGYGVDTPVQTETNPVVQQMLEKQMQRQNELNQRKQEEAQARQREAQARQQEQIRREAAQKQATQKAAAQKKFIDHAANDPDHTHVHLNNVNPAQEKIAKGNPKDILTKANQNTQAYAMDTLHEGDCDLHEGESTLGKVEDLMVCGYSGDLKFDRDFLSEATDMLNSYTL